MGLVIAIPPTADDVSFIRPILLLTGLNMSVAENHVGPTLMAGARQDTVWIGTVGAGIREEQRSRPMLPSFAILSTVLVYESPGFFAVQHFV